jgi:hypothetical protein
MNHAEPLRLTDDGSAFADANDPSWLAAGSEIIGFDI